MPLSKGKSAKAFSQNVKTEMNDGKPQKQAVAIAYAVRRHNKSKKMSQGGSMNEKLHPKAKYYGGGIIEQTENDSPLKSDKRAYAKSKKSGPNAQEDYEIKSEQNNAAPRSHDRERAAEEVRYRDSDEESGKDLECFAEGGLINGEDNTYLPSDHLGLMEDEEGLYRDLDEEPDHMPQERFYKGGMAHEEGDPLRNEPMGDDWRMDEFLADQYGGMDEQAGSEFDPQNEESDEDRRHFASGGIVPDDNELGSDHLDAKERLTSIIQRLRRKRMNMMASGKYGRKR